MGTEIKRCLIVSGAPEADIAYIKPLLPGAFVIAAGIKSAAAWVQSRILWLGTLILHRCRSTPRN